MSSKGLNSQTLKIKAEDTQVGNLTHWRGLSNPDTKKATVLKGLEFIDSFVHKGIMTQIRKITKGY
jgi:hypothetical protein